MAATATASCVSAKVRILPVIRAVDLARVSSRVSRAAACRARDRKPAASWTKRSIWARRASPAVTSHWPSRSLPGPSPVAPQAIRATKAIAPSRVAFAAKPAVRPVPSPSRRSEPCVRET